MKKLFVATLLLAVSVTSISAPVTITSEKGSVYTIYMSTLRKYKNDKKVAQRDVVGTFRSYTWSEDKSPEKLRLAVTGCEDGNGELGELNLSGYVIPGSSMLWVSEGVSVADGLAKAMCGIP